jgi:HPt (histidine-containing phosphotransfer) domain-containing protein
MPEPEGATRAELALLDPDGSFAARLAGDRAALVALAETGRSSDAAETPGLLAEMEVLAHRLAGAAGTFGYAAVGAAALDLEDSLVEHRRSADGPGEIRVREALSRLLRALDDALANR